MWVCYADLGVQHQQRHISEFHGVLEFADRTRGLCMLHPGPCLISNITKRRRLSLHTETGRCYSYAQTTGTLIYHVLARFAKQEKTQGAWAFRRSIRHPT
jgi:hypothetical protein